MKLRSFAFLLAFVLCSLTLFADDVHQHDAGEKLGTVSFPTSCAAAVERPFERGLALLYSFEYEEAENQFKEVASDDPQCAMAYWGQAMSLYHQLWGRPERSDLKRGGELLEKARSIRATTARERDYIEALRVFYRDPDRLDHPRRADLYASAMEEVYKQHPQDREAGVFYALALLASGPERDPQQTNARKAVAVLDKLFDEQPDHPGIAHYIIHACDNPAMADLGLRAARKYASIAPSSPHAVHMPSHIFARLGLWQDDITSNLAAIAAADKMATMHLHTMHHRMHSIDFLSYAYLQIGDDQNAKAMMDRLASLRRQDIEEDYRDYHDSMVTSLRARYAVERRQWKEALALEPVAGARPGVQLETWWAHAVAAGRLHDNRAAQDALHRYEKLMEAVKKGPRAYIIAGLNNEHNEVKAWAAFAAGNNDEALRLMRAVADEQDKVGKGESELPAREMLADMLLEVNRPREALTEYETSLKTDPNRFNGLYGAAQAAQMTEQKQKAAGYYAQLLKNCENSHSDRPELERAKTLVAQN
ncbi:MAG TPA: tetratricopeptide repeat protein [Candidatus Angelobacter sp.]|nr:tetratricopeptide repeat protein [Candidatus Angelobacter sp.]